LDYFETSRRKRNVIDYDFAFVATDTEAEEILSEAKKFNAFAEKWISLENPSLAKIAPDWLCHASDFLHLKCGRGAAINYRNAGYDG